MVATARSKRTYAPKAFTPAEVPATSSKPSIWTRTKTVAAKAVAAVVKPIKRAMRVVKTFALKATFKAAPVLTRLWRLAIKPLLVGVALGAALFGFVVSAVVAPFSTMLLTALAGLFLLMAARGLKRLEDLEHKSRAARITLNVIDMIANVFGVMIYVASAAAVVAMCAVSWAATVSIALFVTLAYFGVRRAGTISFIVFDVLTGNWALAAVWGVLYLLRFPTPDVAEVPAYSEIRIPREEHIDVRRAKDITPAMAPNNPETWTRGNHLRATGTEELWGTEHDQPIVVHDDADEGRAVPVAAWDDNMQECAACGSDKGAMRVRSMNVPFTTAGSKKGVAREVPVERDLLCAACFAAECEDAALALTGVSLDARSVEVRLNKTGIEHAPEHAASMFDPTSFHWLESGWWRDRAGSQHEREWSCLVNGRVVATVVQDHRRKVFRASALGSVVPNGVKTSLEAAKRAAEDELSDEANAVERHVEAAGAASTRTSARRTKKG